MRVTKVQGLPEDDGLVLTDDGLVEPKVIQLAAARKFRGWDGLSRRSPIKRYHANHPDRDATTPTFAEFKQITRGGGPRRAA
jgi:hypothetical protein